MDDPDESRRPARTSRTSRHASGRRPASLLALGALLSACSSGPSYDPHDPEIEEARVLATTRLDAALERVVLPDRFTVLGQGRGDGCGTYSGGANTFADPTGYHCSMGWTVVFVVPDARTRDEVAGAVDAAVAAMDVHDASRLADDLVLGYPKLRDLRVLTGGGVADGVELRTEVTPFDDAWLPPFVGSAASAVSSSGDLDAVDAAAVEATGATEVVTLALSTRYWDTRGLSPVRRGDAGLVLEHYTEGSVYAFDLVHAQPAERAAACAQDAAVDAATVSALDAPFPRLTFSLRQDAVSQDMQRVRECLSTGLLSGAVAVLTPE
ncbi:hypothetical protein GC089_18010 [Cellulomonas sp. JZ18]|uniref:hypothetical protein n=1 Tax=Cellulomonas sp. JZ18 TaxID=2654191 RepID=UPI0012D3B0D8|nr:hypothetical protein [Cellulomonas sp. JZ18]QGQ20738.1 hypothetical protein GC089_18010 [Cellulomonas sp. JZ18]